MVYNGITYDLLVYIEALKEIQRYIRRDRNNAKKEVLHQLGSWNIVEKYLVPLLISYRDENELCFEICTPFNLA
jgi:hypothetical protein